MNQPAASSAAPNEGVSRRGFLKLVMSAGLGLAAVGASNPKIAWADGAGLSRDGVKARFLIGSDLHVQNGIGGTEGRDADKKLQFAFDTVYQIDPQLDAFCLVGDVTDNGTTAQYEHLMALINDGGEHNVGYMDGTGHTKMILCQGNHETYNPGVSAAPARFKQYTGQDATKVLDVNGVTVITMGPAADGSGDGDYRPHYDWFAQQLEEQVGGTTEPFLVLTHHQMQGTSYTSPEWHGNFGQGSGTDFAELMGQYPNLVQVSGHSHATLEDERSISQDLGFTAIQDSTIGAYYENETGKVDPDSGNGASVPPQSSPAYTEGKTIQEASQAVLLDFMEDNTVKAYRLSLVRSKVEGGGVVYLYEPWTIDPDDMGAYTSERESTAAPTWPADAAVTVDNVTNSSAKVSFPAAQPGSDKGDDMVHEYKLVATAGDGSTVTKRVFNDYYRPAAYIRSTWDVLFNGLAAETSYTMSVFAQTSWNKEAGSEGSGTWQGNDAPAPNSTSAALVSAAFTTAGAPERPRAILDIDYRAGVTEDAMGHTPNREQGLSLVTDEEIGFQALEANGSTGWGYRLTAADYEQFTGASTHECYFKLVDNQTDQCLFSNQQSAGAGFEVENGNIEFWYNNEETCRILGTPVETGVWVHAVATYDGENVTLYVNGEQVDQASAGDMTVPSPDRYYVCCDSSSSNRPEICAADGTRVAFARLFPYAMTAGQVRTAYAARLLDPAPEKLLDVNFADAASGSEVADAAGHEPVHTELAATAAIAADETLGQNVFEADGQSAFGFKFTEDDYTYLGNEHALECVFMVHDTATDQCFLSNQQTAGDGLEVAGNSDTRDKMAFWFNSNDSGTPKPAGGVTPDVWHHAMGVYACGKVRLYLDGKLAEELDAAGGLEVPAEAARAYYVGADVYSDGGAQIFTQPGSKIAYANIYSKAPSSARVAELATGFPVDPGAAADTYTVTYAWKDGAAPAGVELPVDETEYKAGDAVTLPSEPAAGSTVSAEKDGKQGTWTFEGWDREDGFEITENTTVTGTWSFAAADDGGSGGGSDGGNGGSGDGDGGGNGGSTGTGGSDGNDGTGAGNGDGANSGDGGSDAALPQTGDLSALVAGGAAVLGSAAVGASALLKKLGGANFADADSSTDEESDEESELDL